MPAALVVSDSHDREKKLLEYLDKLDTDRLGVEWLIHLGDIVSPFTLRRIAEAAARKGLRVVAVFGNNCGEKLGLLRVAGRYGVDLAEPPRTVELGGRRILLVHGFGSPDNTREIVYALADSGRWHAVLYGHTHEQDLAYRRGVLVLNPGEAAGALNPPSVALLDLDTLRVRFVEL